MSGEWLARAGGCSGPVSATPGQVMEVVAPRPRRTAFSRDRALPAGGRRPLDARALARLAASCRGVAMVGLRRDRQLGRAYPGRAGGREADLSPNSTEEIPQSRPL